MIKCIIVIRIEMVNTIIFSFFFNFNLLFKGDDVLTLCQKQQMKAIKNTTRLSRFIPTCKRDGRFEEIQCLRSSGECWCVDEQGKEINGSRTANHLRCPSRGLDEYISKSSLEPFFELP